MCGPFLIKSGVKVNKEVRWILFQKGGLNLITLKRDGLA